MKRVLILLGVFLLVAGCANHGVDYRQAAPRFDGGIAGKSVSVLVFDERPYVLSEDKRPNYVGDSIFQDGSSKGVYTASGDALAADLQTAIISGLKRNRIAAETPQMFADGADRQLHVTLREWKAEYSGGALFDYDITATVKDAEGRELASKSVSGSEEVHNTYNSAAIALRKAVSDIEVRKALAGPDSWVGEMIDRPVKATRSLATDSATCKFVAGATDDSGVYTPSSYICPKNSIYTANRTNSCVWVDDLGYPDGGYNRCASNIRPASYTRSVPSPSRYSSGGPVQVRGYYRKDGTYVRPHTRRSRR